MLELHWYHILNILCSVPYFLFLIFSVVKLFQLYAHNRKKQAQFQVSSTNSPHKYPKSKRTSTTTTRKLFSEDGEEDDAEEEVLLLKPKKFNLHILKQFFFFQMIPFYFLRFVLFLLLGFSGVQWNLDHFTLPMLRWLALFMCLYIIGSVLLQNNFFLSALYWAEHVSYHHGLGLVVVEAKMKLSRIVYVVFSALWIIFSLTICSLTIYFVYTLKETCFRALRILLHTQYSFNVFLSATLAVWFLGFAYNRKKSLFNWNTQLDARSTDPFVQFVKKKRRETFICTIICILLFFFQSLFSITYFEIYNGIYNVKHSGEPTKKEQVQQLNVLLGFWITKGVIDFTGELISFILYFVFTYDEIDESSIRGDNADNKPFTFFRRTADAYEKNSLIIAPVTHISTVSSNENSEPLDNYDYSDEQHD